MHSYNVIFLNDFAGLSLFVHYLMGAVQGWLRNTEGKTHYTVMLVLCIQ